MFLCERDPKGRVGKRNKTVHFNLGEKNSVPDLNCSLFILKLSVPNNNIPVVTKKHPIQTVQRPSPSQNRLFPNCLAFVHLFTGVIVRFKICMYGNKLWFVNQHSRQYIKSLYTPTCFLYILLSMLLYMICSKPPCKRTINQFHYTAWPDHGTPEELWLIQFQSHATKRFQTDSPLLVHCRFCNQLSRNQFSDHFFLKIGTICCGLHLDI